jgi:hypothetical protein
MTFIKRLLHDLTTLKRPVTAAAFVATIVALVSPLGLDVGPNGAVLTAALVAVGTVAAYVESRSGDAA